MHAYGLYSTKFREDHDKIYDVERQDCNMSSWQRQCTVQPSRPSQCHIDCNLSSTSLQLKLLSEILPVQPFQFNYRQLNLPSVILKVQFSQYSIWAD